MMDTDLYLNLIRRNFPHIAIQMVRPVTRGWDSFVLDINDAFIFRFPLRDDVIPYLEKELCLLPQLEQALSVPVPHFTYIGEGDEHYPYTFVGYPKIAGQSLENKQITDEQLMKLAPALATFLNELHGFPLERAMRLLVESHTPEQWRERYRERYEDIRRRVFPLLDANLCAKSVTHWESFLSNESLFTFRPALIHGDLGCEHIFCDPERGVLTGVIDWGDATIGDPALDFVGLHIGHGGEFVQQVLAGYQHPIDNALRQRIAFYLTYEPFSELLYGAYSNREDFIDSGREGLRTLFGK
ncbi:MAG TPA: phosphotransferase [Ktedonobacteraceae bacterium]|nr:phosphotransferase [Ktedonobacteraceae bacterium]